MRSIRILRRFTWSCVQEASWEFWALNQFERKSFLAVASYCPSNIIQELTAVFFFFFQMLSHVQHIIQIIRIIKEVLIWIMFEFLFCLF